MNSIHPVLRDPPAYRDTLAITLGISAGAIIAAAYLGLIIAGIV